MEFSQLIILLYNKVKGFNFKVVAELMLPTTGADLLEKKPDSYKYNKRATRRVAPTSPINTQSIYYLRFTFFTY